MALAVLGLQRGNDLGIALGQPRAEGRGAHRLPVGIALLADAAGTSGMGEMPCIRVRI